MELLCLKYLNKLRGQVGAKEGNKDFSKDKHYHSKKFLNTKSHSSNTMLSNKGDFTSSGSSKVPSGAHGTITKRGCMENKVYQLEQCSMWFLDKHACVHTHKR